MNKTVVEGTEPWRQTLLPFTEDEIISDFFADTCWASDIDYSQPVEIRRQQFRSLMEAEWQARQEREARV